MTMRAASRPVPVVWSVMRPPMVPAWAWARAAAGAPRRARAASSGTSAPVNR